MVLAALLWVISTLSWLSAPPFLLVGDRFSKSVTLETPTDGAVIRYTTNNSEPTSSSPLYSRPIALTTSQTIKAKAFHADWDIANSPTASEDVSVEVLQAPTISPSGGLYYEPVIISATSNTGAQIRINTQGKDPMTHGYWTASGPFTYSVSRNLVIRAYAEGIWSEPASANFVFKASQPSISIINGTVTLKRTDSWQNEGTLLYTTDVGSNPTWKTYSNNFTLIGDNTIRTKVAGIDSVQESDIASEQYVSPFVLNMSASEEGRYIHITPSNGQSLPEGTEIYYTTGPNPPAEGAEGTLYDGSGIYIPVGRTVKARAQIPRRMASNRGFDSSTQSHSASGDQPI